MSLIEKQNNTLKEVQCLLKDIESELHFRSPHSSKLIDIRDMLEWLEGGRLVGYFEALYGEGKGIRSALDASKSGDIWESPIECILNRPESTAQIMLKLTEFHGEELIYEPLICEAGKPFYFILLKSRCQEAVEAFVILFCHYLRYMEVLNWDDIRPDNVDDLIGDKLIYSLAMCRESSVSGAIVMNEADWHISIALDDILEHSDKPHVGVMYDEIQIDIDENYEPPINPLIHNAIQLELDNDNPLFFFETETEYVFFGS